MASTIVVTTLFLLVLCMCTTNSIDGTKYCKVGEYFHPEKHICAKCKVCQPGEASVRVCSKFRNAKCEECSYGTFSQNGTCLNCTVCFTQFERPCNISFDAVCATAKPDNSSKFSLSQWLIAVITVSVLFALLLAIVAVLICLRRRHRSKPDEVGNIELSSNYMAVSKKMLGDK